METASGVNADASVLLQLSGLITDGIAMVRRKGYRELAYCPSEKMARGTLDWILSKVWPDRLVVIYSILGRNGERIFLPFRGPDALQNARLSKRIFLEIQKNAISVSEEIRNLQSACRSFASLVPFYLDRLDEIANEAVEHIRFIDSEINRLVHSQNPTSAGYVDQKSTGGIPQSTGEAVNSWVKQTGFEAPSPLAPTKGSKGLLGNCSTAGQVVTGLVVGGAIFALYKTCKK